MDSSLDTNTQRLRSMSDSASPLFGSKQPRYIRSHSFQVRNYKRPTFCAHCKQMLLGVVKQGLRCKRCDVDVHEKCQEDLVQPCVELISGHHHFRLKSYKQLTYCDHCTKLLVGVMNQGLRCTECGANTHDKCQEKIEAKCAEVKERRRLHKHSSIEGKHYKKAASSSQKKMKKMDSLSVSLQSLPQADDEEAIIGQRKYSFQLMTHSDHTDRQTNPTSLPGSPVRKPRSIRSRSLIPYGNNLREQIGEVSGIMQSNFQIMKSRGDSLVELKKKSESLNESARLFDSSSKQIKNEQCLKKNRLRICLAITAALIVAIVVVVLLLFNKQTPKS